MLSQVLRIDWALKVAIPLWRRQVILLGMHKNKLTPGVTLPQSVHLPHSPVCFLTQNILAPPPFLLQLVTIQSLVMILRLRLVALGIERVWSPLGRETHL